jgi:rSAM/selenodomain-associated transferase 1
MINKSAHNLCQAIVFVKAPKLGQVKTRLAKHLDGQTVLDIYKCAAADVIQTVRQRVDHIKICYYPSGETRLVKNWLGDAFEYEPQVGVHLGERMKNAFVSCFKGSFTRAILVGTDLPGLSKHVILESFEKLNHQTAVLGPTYDGGYYLIGFRKDLFIPQVFEDMPWGTRQVFENTLDIFKQADCRVHILPKCRDIDTYDDLIEFGKGFKSAEIKGGQTIAYLKSLKLA